MKTFGRLESYIAFSSQPGRVSPNELATYSCFLLAALKRACPRSSDFTRLFVDRQLICAAVLASFPASRLVDPRFPKRAPLVLPMSSFHRLFLAEDSGMFLPRRDPEPAPPRHLYRSIYELIAAIIQYIDSHNESPKLLLSGRHPGCDPDGGNSLILRRPFHAIHDQRVNRAFGAHEFQSKLFLKSGEERRTGILRVM